MRIFDIQKKYSSKIDSLDIGIIISYAIKKNREFVLSHPEKVITRKQTDAISKMIKRRLNHEPLAYILGYKEFFGLNFKVNKNVLVPRPETELLIEKVLLMLRSMLRNKTTIIDLGTGSGNIIISVAKNLKTDLPFYGADISEKALCLAKENAKENKVSKKIKFIKSDLLNYFLKNNSTIKKFENLVIIANLPYLDSGYKSLLKSAATKSLKHEPAIALYSGKDGLDAYRQLAKQIKKIKLKRIILFCEIGHLQKTEFKKIFSFAKKITFYKDLAKKWRVAKVEL